MPLEVSVLSVKGHPPAEAMDISFDQDGGTIGRLSEEKDNHLFLPDPDRYISRIHATISYRDGHYYLTDSSIDGTYHRNRTTRIHDESARLADGDRIWIGDYELVVRIHSADLFEATASAADNLSQTQSVDVQANLTTSDENAPWWPDADGENVEDHDWRPDSGDQANNAGLDEAFSPPDVINEASPAEQIPTDFNFEELIQDIDSQPEQRKAKPSDAVPDSDHDAGDAAPQEEKNRFFIKDGEIPKTARFLRKDIESIPDAPEFSAIFDQPDKGEKPEQTHVETAHDEPERHQPVGQYTDSDGLRLFLDAAGVKNTNRFQQEDIPHLMHTLGTVFREMVIGLVTLLKGRAEQKIQLRMSTTQIMPADNNPLKFFDNIEETIDQLITGDKPGFVDSQAAVREGFAEIMNHHLAMTAGIQAAVIHLIEQFDPLRFQEQHKENAIFSKKAKLWDAFQEAYAQIAHTALDDFFGEALSRAYEAQLSKLQHQSENLSGPKTDDLVKGRHSDGFVKSPRSRLSDP